MSAFRAILRMVLSDLASQRSTVVLCEHLLDHREGCVEVSLRGELEVAQGRLRGGSG